jgi:hypothetical protein
MDEDLKDLRYGALDLYRKVNDQMGWLLRLAPSTMALVASLKELDPRFDEVYGRHFQVASRQKELQDLAALRDLLAQAVETLEKKWGLQL